MATNPVDITENASSLSGGRGRGSGTNEVRFILYFSRGQTPFPLVGSNHFLQLETEVVDSGEYYEPEFSVIRVCFQRFLVRPEFVGESHVLVRPAFVRASQATFQKVNSDLQSVPMDAMVKRITSGLLHVIQTSMIENEDRYDIPLECEVVVHDLGEAPPTHVVAVHSGPNSLVSLFPVHALILFTHCSKLHKFPYSNPERLARAGSTLTLPVVPLQLRDPTTFQIFLTHLYSKSGATILSLLFPYIPPDERMSLEDHEDWLSTLFTPNMIFENITRVHGLWTNMEDLGVLDEVLWAEVEWTWEVLLLALKRASSISNQL